MSVSMRAKLFLSNVTEAIGGYRSGHTPPFWPVYVTMPMRISFCTFCTTSRMPAFMGSHVLLGLLSHWLDERSTTISAVGVRASKLISTWLQPTRSAASSPKVRPLSMDWSPEPFGPVRDELALLPSPSG